MFEKTVNYCKEHKEKIKTGVILVLTPIAFMGILASKGLNDVAHFLSNASDQAVKEDK